MDLMKQTQRACFSFTDPLPNTKLNTGILGVSKVAFLGQGSKHLLHIFWML